MLQQGGLGFPGTSRFPQRPPNVLLPHETHHLTDNAHAQAGSTPGKEQQENKVNRFAIQGLELNG
jgi:hypothetical protein